MRIFLIRFPKKKMPSKNFLETNPRRTIRRILTEISERTAALRRIAAKISTKISGIIPG